MLLGLFIVVFAIPGLTYASIPAGWAAMSIVLPWTLWREPRWSPLHSLFLAFLGFACASFLWTYAYWEGGFRLWQLCLLFLAFRLGSCGDITEIVEGVVIGCCLSSALALAQHFNLIRLLQLSTESAGLFYNHVVAGQTLAIALVAAFALGLWRYLPLLLPGIYLSGSRGAWIVVAFGVAFTFFRSQKLLALAILLGLFAVTLSSSTHDAERMLIWKTAFLNLSLFGKGIGSFAISYMWDGSRLFYPENAHNDALQLLFEFGIGALLLFLLGHFALYEARYEWPIIASAIFLGFFAFPLFVPVTAFLLALCAGHASRHRTWTRYRLPSRRQALTIWRTIRQPFPSQPRESNLPIQP